MWSSIIYPQKSCDTVTPKKCLACFAACFVIPLTLFLKKIGGYISFLGGHLYPCFEFMVTSPLGFKALVSCLTCSTEANVIYIPCDPPLMLHLPTSWQSVWLPVLSPHTVASRCEIARIRTHALRISVSQTRTVVPLTLDFNVVIGVFRCKRLDKSKALM